MRRRPLSPHPVLFTRPPGSMWPSHQSFADILRRRERVVLYCTGCSPALTIETDFSRWPWTRYLNYPVSELVCPTCGQRVTLTRHDGPGVPGRGNRLHDDGKYGQ